MIPLKSSEVDTFDIDSILKSKCIQELLFDDQEFNGSDSDENDQVDTDKFKSKIIDFNHSVDQRNYELLVNTLNSMFMLLNNKKYISQEIITEMKVSNFFQSINECISTIEVPELISLIALVLLFFAFLSDDLIEGMYQTGTLGILMEILKDPNSNISISILFILFGNVCSLKKFAFLFYDDIFNEILNHIPSSSTKIQKNCFYCLYVLTKSIPIPNEHVCPLFMQFRVAFQNFNELSNDKYIILNYIIDILEMFSNDNERSFYIVQVQIPSFFLCVISNYPDEIQKKILEIIQNTLKNTPKGEENSLFSQDSIRNLTNLLDSSNNEVILIIYSIFYDLVMCNDDFILDLISEGIINISIDLIDAVNFNAKVSILNFLALLLASDKIDEYIDEHVNDIATEKVVEEFIGMAQQEENFVKHCSAAIMKLYSLTYERQELNSMLEPYIA